MTITKNKAIYRITAIAMALCMLMALSVSAFAAEVNANGGSAQTPVNLTTSNDGIGGEASDTATKLSVTVPTALPMAMSDDGNVVTATDCKIVNNSYGAVRVKSVTISAAENWNLTAFGDKKTLASEKVDSNKLGFAITIGGGQQMQTSTNEKTQKLRLLGVLQSFKYFLTDTVCG